MIKNMVKKILFYINKNRLKNNNIVINSNVTFRNTIFGNYNRICSNTAVDNSKIDNFSYIGWNSILRNVQIGSFCSIAPFVEVIYGTHPINLISTHPIFYSSRKQCGISFLKENKIDDFNLIGKNKSSVIIANDVWIGYGSKIIEGVTINNGAVILAGSVVTKDVEAYSVVGGIPAKHIKYRFDKDKIDFLNTFQWWNKDINWIKENIHLFINPESFFNEVNNDTKNF